MLERALQDFSVVFTLACSGMLHLTYPCNVACVAGTQITCVLVAALRVYSGRGEIVHCVVYVEVAVKPRTIRVQHLRTHDLCRNPPSLAVTILD